MPMRDVLRYGLYYAFIYVGVLGVILVGAAIIASFYEFRSSDLSLGALLAAAPFAYLRFLKDKVRFPTRPEYWSLVAIGSIIVLVVDFAVAALVIHFTRDYSLDGTAVLIMIAFPLFKGVLGNMIFFRSGGFGKRTLEQIEAKQSRHGSPATAQSNKMTFGDLSAFIVVYFAVYTPLYGATRYVSVTGEVWGEQWLPPAITIAAAVCALAYIVRRLGRRPTLSEYGLLVLVSVVSATVFEIVGEMAIYHYRFARVPSVRTLLDYTIGAVVVSAGIHGIVYSRPVAWLVRQRTRSA